MNPLFNMLRDMGDDAINHAAKYGTKASSNEMRDGTLNVLADLLTSGKKHPSGIGLDNVLKHTPMLYRAEDFQRTAARTAPEYQNVAATTLDMAPLGFGGGRNDSHLTLLDPEIMNRPGQKALALEDTAWMAPKGMDPKLAQDRLFIDEFGAKKVKDRNALRDIAWDNDNLNRIRETAWMELNAPISNKDVILSGRKHVTFPDGKTGDLSSKDETLSAIIEYLKNGSMDRQSVMGRINKILPVVSAVPTAGVLGSLLGSSNQENI